MLISFIILQILVAAVLIFNLKEENFAQNLIIFSIAFFSLVGYLIFIYFRERKIYKELFNTKESLEYEVQKRTQELKENSKLLRTILETIPIPVFYKDLDGRYLTCNRAFSKLAGIPKEEIIGKVSEQIFSKELTKQFNLSDKKALKRKNTYHFDGSFQNDKSKIHYVTIYKKALIQDDKAIGIIGAIHDISKQKNSQARLEKALGTLKIQQNILENDYEIIQKYTIYTKMNTNYQITEVSEGLCDLLGYTKEEVMHMRHYQLQRTDENDPIYIEIRSVISQGKAWSGEFLNYTKDGNEVWTRTTVSPEFNDEKKITGFVTFSQDISREKMMQEHSYKDELTKLFNRKKFNEELEMAINLFERYKDDTALVLFDIDKFKEINDQHGHLIGDNILKELANLLKKNVRECDIVARWGGEEFTIILPKTNKENAILAVKKLREKIISHNFEIDKNVTCSFGITTIKEKDNTTTIIKRVDDMLYEAKNKGRDKIIHD